MDKKDINDVYKLMQETSKLQACSSKKCSDLKMKLMNDKKYIAINAKYKSEKNEKKKDKLLDTISKNELLYNYNKCILKNCKNIYKNLLNIMKLNLNTLPKTHPKYKDINNFISELEKLMSTKTTLTKEENKLFLKNSRNLINAMSKI